MDVKAKITETAEKIVSNKSLLEQFKKDPEKVIESLLGVDLPDGMVDKVITAVKAKLGTDAISDVAGKLKKLF